MSLSYTFLSSATQEDDCACILLHGFGGSKKSFRPKSELKILTKHCAVLIPDMIGAGASPYPLQEDTYTVENQAKEMNGLLHSCFPQENIKFAVVGVSFGFLVALQMAATNSRVKWLISIDGTFELSPSAVSRGILAEGDKRKNSREFARFHTCVDFVSKIDQKWPQQTLQRLVGDKARAKDVKIDDNLQVLFLLSSTKEPPSWLSDLGSVVSIRKSRHSLHLENPVAVYGSLLLFLLKK